MRIVSILPIFFAIYVKNPAKKRLLYLRARVVRCFGIFGLQSVDFLWSWLFVFGEANDIIRKHYGATITIYVRAVIASFYL